MGRGAERGGRAGRREEGGFHLCAAVPVVPVVHHRSTSPSCKNVLQNALSFVVFLRSLTENPLQNNGRNILNRKLTHKCVDLTNKTLAHVCYNGERAHPFLCDLSQTRLVT